MARNLPLESACWAPRVPPMCLSLSPHQNPFQVPSFNPLLPAASAPSAAPTTGLEPGLLGSTGRSETSHISITKHYICQNHNQGGRLRSFGRPRAPRNTGINVHGAGQRNSRIRVVKWKFQRIRIVVNSGWRGTNGFRGVVEHGMTRKRRKSTGGITYIMKL